MPWISFSSFNNRGKHRANHPTLLMIMIMTVYTITLTVFHIDSHHTFAPHILVSYFEPL